MPPVHLYIPQQGVRDSGGQPQKFRRTSDAAFGRQQLVTMGSGEGGLCRLGTIYELQIRQALINVYSKVIYTDRFESLRIGKSRPVLDPSAQLQRYPSRHPKRDR